MDKSISVYLRSWGSSALSVGAGPEHIASSRKCRPWLFPWYPQTESISHKSMPNKAVHQGAKVHINLYLYRFTAKQDLFWSEAIVAALKQKMHVLYVIKDDCPPCVCTNACVVIKVVKFFFLCPQMTLESYKKKKMRNTPCLLIHYYIIHYLLFFGNKACNPVAFGSEKWEHFVTVSFVTFF